MRALFFGSLFFCLCCQSTPKTVDKQHFYIGTYTRTEGHVDGKGDGIYRLQFDPATQQFTVLDTLSGMVNPSFLALSPDQQTLYAVNEIGPGTGALGQFESYDIREGQAGTRLSVDTTGGFAPCHIALNAAGSMAVVSNYVGGVVSVYPLPRTAAAPAQIIRLESVDKKHPRQESSHPHSAVFSADGKLVYVADLGTDRIMLYQVDAATRRLTPAPVPFFTLPDGSGPRHMAFAPNGKTLYVLAELSNMVHVFEVEANGNLREKQAFSTLPAGVYVGENTSADIHLSPNGRVLYTSNRGHNSLAVFKANPEGQLEALGHVSTHGKVPRNFYPTSDGKWVLVANQNSDDIALFDASRPGLPMFVKNFSIRTPVAIVQTR